VKEKHKAQKIPYAGPPCWNDTPQGRLLAQFPVVCIPAVKNMAYICGTKGQTHPFPPKQVL